MSRHTLSAFLHQRAHVEEVHFIRSYFQIISKIIVVFLNFKFLCFIKNALYMELFPTTETFRKEIFYISFLVLKIHFVNFLIRWPTLLPLKA